MGLWSLAIGSVQPGDPLLQDQTEAGNQHEDPLLQQQTMQIAGDVQPEPFHYETFPSEYDIFSLGWQVDHEQCHETQSKLIQSNRNLEDKLHAANTELDA
eukprot:3719860-Rhodomonas_salina.1